jgi:hypothetical protein
VLQKKRLVTEPLCPRGRQAFVLHIRTQQAGDLSIEQRPRRRYPRERPGSHQLEPAAAGLGGRFHSALMGDKNCSPAPRSVGLAWMIDRRGGPASQVIHPFQGSHVERKPTAGETLAMVATTAPWSYA